MKQVAQNYKNGELAVLDVPTPACRAGGVLVRSLYSLISTGTEVMKVTEANLSLVGKAKARPDQVRKVLDTVAQQGPVATFTKVMHQLDSYTPLGYSLCGVVVEVGRGAEEFEVGQIVACAGNEYALHAEVNWVPRNLCVGVPDGVAPQLAAFATVGAIAMQGVRRAEPALGEAACVVGLGLVGQLTVQLLVAAGVDVVGIDTVAERCRLAEKAGALACETPDAAGVERLEAVLAKATGGLGADHVLLTAGGASNGPVETAARLARDRARVVDVGKLKLDLPWNAYYDKELELRFSRSYGPGRYDENYELGGIDYPAGYVRWTERRNLACFLDLLGRGSLNVDLLVTETCPVEDAADVYRRLSGGALGGIGFLFKYPGAGVGAARPAVAAQSVVAARPAVQAARPAVRALRSAVQVPVVRIGFVGAGNYASSMLLPHLAKRKDVKLVRVATHSSLSAANAKRRFGFATASTDTDGLLADESLDAVFVVTRHHNHAELVCQALAAGKAVFVEKPLALSDEQLARVLETVAETGNDRLMVGFNRRFAPLLVGLRNRYGAVPDGSTARYLVNAGTLGAKSWYNQESLEGSRFLGEGGHFLDTAAWWLGAEPVSVSAMTARDRRDLHVAVRYANGSLATIDYVTHGNPRFPKETFEAAGGRRSARLDNFTKATTWSGRRRSTKRSFGSLDKGQAGALGAFVDSIRTGSAMPIPLASLAATTAATIAVERSLAAGAPIALAG